MLSDWLLDSGALTALFSAFSATRLWFLHVIAPEKKICTRIVPRFPLSIPRTAERRLCLQSQSKHLSISACLSFFCFSSRSFISDNLSVYGAEFAGKAPLNARRTIPAESDGLIRADSTAYNVQVAFRRMNTLVCRPVPLVPLLQQEMQTSAHCVRRQVHARCTHVSRIIFRRA